MTEATPLMLAARKAGDASYSPYSKFRVGAALMANGKTFTGANVENASYGLTICAERVAIFSAIAAGARRIECIAVTCAAAEDSPLNHLMPCGACRQVMIEFMDTDGPVEVDRVGTFKLSELLPSAFAFTRNVS